jgi:pimeloyl-ACP methyl ester carboxylesterase
VQLSAGKLAVAFLAIFAFIGVHSAPSQAQIAFGRCGDSNDFACGHLTVPLDPSGATQGTITLTLRRHRAPVGEAHDAVIALAGGPGQSAIPFAENFAELLGPIISTRDLIVLDQRGTGLSHPLSCHAFESSGGDRSATQQISTCAGQIGPSRAFFTTADSVADIEAVRQAGGYEKLVLYGTSYGTKVAERYAQTYPGHVEALVLDSVVPPNGPDPLNRSTFAAVPRILRQLCANGACAHITSQPVSDLARVVRRMGGGRLHGRVIDREGRGHTIPINSDDLLDLLVVGDFSPLLRAEFITATRAAADGDTAPLARLLTLADSGGEESNEGSDSPLYFATTCEEEIFPWSRALDPRARLQQAKAAIKALNPSALTPFTAANMLDFGDFEGCAAWPFSTPAPIAYEAPLPNVPTLIVSGADDLRTPTANAQAVAAQIPDSHLLVVPDAGHSVLTDEPTACARDALLAQFANRPIKPCPAYTPPAILRPPPLPPTRLAEVPPERGYSGGPGRTLKAVQLTLSDLGHQLASVLLSSPETLLSALSGSIRSGGLRAGWAQFSGKELSFHGYSYVPGVTLSGTIKSERADLRIGGSSATHGTLRLGSRMMLVGVLGGQHVHIAPSPKATAAIVGADAQASAHLGPINPAARAVAVAALRHLASLLRWRP